MRFIGITGGVGSGKSSVLEYLKSRYDAYIIRSDDVARDLVRPGNECYESYLKLFGEEALGADGEFKRDVIASKVFADPGLRLEMNALIHPAVKKYILGDVERVRLSGCSYYFLEAALLIEEHYDKICDELWYVYASEKVRRERLMAGRGYSSEKIDAIISSQTKEDEFRRVCTEVIDNSGDMEETRKQIDKIINQNR